MGSSAETNPASPQPEEWHTLRRKDFLNGLLPCDVTTFFYLMSDSERSKLIDRFALVSTFTDLLYFLYENNNNLLYYTYQQMPVEERRVIWDDHER